jgi:hypothetical protein
MALKLVEQAAKIRFQTLSAEGLSRRADKRVLQKDDGNA